MKYNPFIESGSEREGDMKNIFLAALLGAATAADFKRGKIPNKLIIFGYLTGLMIRITEGGPAGLALGILEGLLTLAAFYIFYLTGAVGAGDVKLLSVIGLFSGIVFAVRTAFYSLLTAGVVAAIYLLKSGEAAARFQEFFSHIGICISQKKLIRYRTSGDKGNLHYALYISIGFLVTLALGKEFR